MIVEEVVSEMMHRPLEIKRSELSYKNNCSGKYKSSREIRVYRTNVVSEPFVVWDKHKPVKYKSKKIPSKYHYHESSEEPHISMCYTLVTKESCCICENAIDNIKTKCSNTRKLICTDSCIEYHYKSKKHNHKNPRRKNCGSDMNAEYIPPSNNITLGCKDMWTNMLCGWFVNDFWRSAHIL